VRNRRRGETGTIFQRTGWDAPEAFLFRAGGEFTG
jgi:hypothetical protein